MSTFIKNNGINGNKEGFGRLKGPLFPPQAANGNGFVRNGFFGSKSPVMNTNNNFNGNLDKGISSNSNMVVSDIREKGFIEKLLTSYGFVQCTDRKGRFFFHYSEYKGALSLLKIGDAVEFQESLDKRTGKPVAVSLVKVSSEEEVAEVAGKPVEGTILAEARPSSAMLNGGEVQGDGMGRVTYEQGGEMFFLPFSSDDVEGGVLVETGDRVLFFVCSDERSGTPRARGVRRLSVGGGGGGGGGGQQTGEACQGVVCSMKDSYGFIERADVVKEIFFHFSEFEGDIDSLRLGDDVQFGIQSRNNKDVAVNISKLPAGTVVFEDVAKEWKRGKIKKTIKMASLKKQNEALVGRIVYETLSGAIEIPFGEKDPQGDFTMVVGDIVEFCIATDRRDMVQHATNIRLVDDTFAVAKEAREKGFVTTLKEGFGFIRCTDREARMFFHFSELLNADQDIHLQDELEFTVVQDPSNVTRQVAIRIKVLPLGTIHVPETFLLAKLHGVVQKEASNNKPMLPSPGCKEPDPGVIMYEVEGTKQMLPYSCSVVDGNLPKLDDKVEFQISECQKNRTKVAVNVKVLGQRGGRERGFVVTIKEAFGFIETADHEREIYFHFNNYEGDVEGLEVGAEVEFQVCSKQGRVSAEAIRRLPLHSISTGEVVACSVLEGRVLRAIHSSPDSQEYFGIIQQILSEAPPPSSTSSTTPTPTTTITTTTTTTTTSSPSLSPSSSSPEPSPLATTTTTTGPTFPFSIMSLVDKRDTLMSRGDCVRFQVVEVAAASSSRLSRSNSTSGEAEAAGVRRWACNVACTRKFLQARIEALHENGGVLSHEKEAGVKLTFSAGDTHHIGDLSVGDDVDFVVATLPGGDKVAVNVLKSSDRPRPDRLISRLKSTADDPRVVTIRQPRGPDGSKGFRLRRVFAGEVEGGHHHHHHHHTALKHPPLEALRCGEGEVGMLQKALEVGLSVGVVDRAGGDVATSDVLCDVFKVRQ